VFDHMRFFLTMILGNIVQLLNWKTFSLLAFFHESKEGIRDDC
jgi:hypothetical protein